MLILLTIAVIFNLASCSREDFDGNDKVIASISTGHLQGYKVIARNNNASVHIYKAVPFAAPPIGQLRFAMPRPALAWSGLRNARNYSLACPSDTAYTSSPQKKIGEDCLYLNVWAGAKCRVTKCPVIFYIHGGGFYFDSAVMFPDGAIVENFASQGVVFMIPAFRLGFMGLLNFDNEDLVPKNLGLYDLIHALKWVKNEIQHFGGDSNRVTIMGHSGGGDAVMILTLIENLNSHAQHKLFQQGVVLSAEDATVPNHISVSASLVFAKKNKCTDEKTTITDLKNAHTIRKILNCLRKVPAMQLLANQRAIEDEWHTFSGLAGIIMPSRLLPGDLFELQRRRELYPLMTGSTVNEFAWNNRTLETCTTVVRMLHFKNINAIVDACIRRYGNNGKVNVSIEDQGLFAYTLSNCRTMETAGGNCYLYSYDDPNNSLHKDGISMLLGIHPFDYNEDQKRMAKIYPKYFVDFAKFGRPAKEWQKFRKGEDNYFSININQKSKIKPENKNHYHGVEMDFWLTKMRLLDLELTKTGEMKNFLLYSMEKPPSTIQANNKRTGIVYFLLTVGFLCLLIYLASFLVTQRITTRPRYHRANERTYLLDSPKRSQR